MFIIIIVVALAVIFLININYRVEALEHKISLLDGTKTVGAPAAPVQDKPQPAPVTAPVQVPKEEKPHQDNFAKNIAKVGIAILVLGVLFFLNYIDRQGLIGPVFKYIAGLLFATALLGVAEYIKHKSKSYVNLLRGAAFIIFYLTIIVGFTLFKIVSLPITLALTALVLALSVIISLKENEKIPFNFGIFGAYFTLMFLVDPVDYVLALSYVLLLNIAVMYISSKKDWISSSVIGFIFTWFLYLVAVGTNLPKNVLFIFSTLFGLQYLIIFLMRDFKESKTNSTVVLTVINTAIYLMAFYDIASGTSIFPYIGYFFALLGVFHFVVYGFLKTIHQTKTSFVALTHFVISVLLVTIAIPLQFDGPYVTTLFFVEGVVLSLLTMLKDFKNKSIMYIMGFGATVLGILHMLSFGNYEKVTKTGLVFLNQSYLVWFAVFVLINVIAYVWYKTVSDSEDAEFKDSIHKAAFVFVVIGQVLFVGLTATEIQGHGSYRRQEFNTRISDARALDYKLQMTNDYAGIPQLRDNYAAEYAEIKSISTQTTFAQLVLFMLMTIIYFMIGLMKKNKTVRNMGIATLVITSFLLITLTWALGPVYRIITFIGFGIALLVISYLYISKTKKHEAAN